MATIPRHVSAHTIMCWVPQHVTPRVTVPKELTPDGVDDLRLPLLLSLRVLSALVPSRGHRGRQRQRHLALGHHVADEIGPVGDDAIYAKVEHLLDLRRVVHGPHHHLDA